MQGIAIAITTYGKKRMMIPPDGLLILHSRLGFLKKGSVSLSYSTSLILDLMISQGMMFCQEKRKNTGITPRY
jgi:hypothetical protein